MATMAWEPATVVAIREETATAKTFTFRLPRPSAHLAGQHYILKLTAPDGYSAQRPTPSPRLLTSRTLSI